jgi:hypothetical protein
MDVAGLTQPTTRIERKTVNTDRLSLADLFLVGGNGGILADVVGHDAVVGEHVMGKDKPLRGNGKA